MHRGSEGMAYRAHDPRQGLRPRRRGGVAHQHEEPDARVRTVHPRRPDRPAAGNLRRQGHAALRREAPGPPAPAGDSGEVNSMRAELVSIPTGTVPLDGLYYEPE